NPVSFRTRSDDASVIYIDNALVVNNDVNQGTTTRGATMDLTPGMHLVEVEYGQGGGGAGMTAQWDPQGGTAFTDFPDGVNSFYTSPTTGNMNRRDPNNGVNQATSGHHAPASGDTIIFSSNTTTNPGFTSNAFTSNNDISGLTLNGIVLDNSGG